MLCQMLKTKRYQLTVDLTVALQKPEAMFRLLQPTFVGLKASISR